jgi:hypothetical protein
MEPRLDSAIKGCNAAFPPGVTALQVRNVSLNQADLNTKLVSLNQPFKDARAAHSSLRQFSPQKSQFTKAGEQFLADLKAALAGAVGADNQLLTQWGFKPLKPHKPLTSEQKVLRAAKAKLTRQKRGTLGKAQKAAIKNTTTPNVVVGADGTSQIVSASSSNGNGTTPPAVPTNSITNQPTSNAGNAASSQPAVSGNAGNAVAPAPNAGQ